MPEHLSQPQEEIDPHFVARAAANANAAAAKETHNPALAAEATAQARAAQIEIDRNAREAAVRSEKLVNFLRYYRLIDGCIDRFNNGDVKTRWAAVRTAAASKNTYSLQTAIMAFTTCFDAIKSYNLTADVFPAYSALVAPVSSLRGMQQVVSKLDIPFDELS